MELTTTAELSNMNVRAEKAGEDVGEGACDLTFAAQLNIDTLCQLFGDADGTRTFMQAMYDGEHPLPNLQKMTWNREINAVSAHLEPDFSKGLSLDGCSLDKIVTAPDNGRWISVKFRIQCHPSAEQVGRLYELQGRDVELSLSTSQGDMFDGQGEPAGDDDGQAEAQAETANELE